MRFFKKIRVKRTEESSLEVDSSVPLTHHDPKDLGLICLVKKRKIHFRILLDFRIQSWIFLKKRTLGKTFTLWKKQKKTEKIKNLLIEKNHFKYDACFLKFVGHRYGGHENYFISRQIFWRLFWTIDKGWLDYASLTV